MIGQDILNRVGVARAISPVTQTNADTALVSQIIDMSQYLGGMFVIASGTLSDADATFAVTMDESDASDLSGSNAVAAVDLLPTPNNLVSTAALTLASFTFAADDAVRTIGYNGTKNYVRLTITPTGNNAGAAPLAAIWVGIPRNRGMVTGA